MIWMIAMIGLIKMISFDYSDWFCFMFIKVTCIMILFKQFYWSPDIP